MLASREKMENVLIIKHGALGDFVQVLGIMGELKRQHPEARFTLLTMAPFVSIAEQTGVFSDYIIDNRGLLIDTWKTLRKIIAGNYTRVYDLQSTSRTYWYRRIQRVFARSGTYRWSHVCKGGYVITKKGRFGLGKSELTGPDIPWVCPDLRFLHGEGKHFDRLPERYVLLIPGCSPQHAYKRWPVEYYREIVRRLKEQGVPAVVIGTKAEKAEADAICEGFDHVVNMVGLTSLLDVPQVAARAMAAVGNDTGPSHMASLTGICTIAIFDQRNAKSVMVGPQSINLVSSGGVSLITPDEVWSHLESRLKVN